MYLKKLFAGALMAAGLAGSASAALIITVEGPDNGTDLDFSFEYASASGAHPDLVTLILNLPTGTTLTYANVAQQPYGNYSFTLQSYNLAGSNPSFTFSDWDDDETFLLTNIDLQPGSPTVQSLINMTISAAYSNGTTEYYKLVDDTGPGNSDKNGLKSVATSAPPPPPNGEVPIPATAFLLGAGLLGLGAASRRRQS